MALALLLAGLVLPVAAWSAGDVGLYTGVAGRATYRAAGAPPGAAAQKLEAMFKAREGDRVTVAAGGVVRLVYFATGRQESWKGPASFVVGAGRSRPEGGAKPEVVSLPRGPVRRLNGLPGRVYAGRRIGGTPVRGEGMPPAETLEPAAWEREEIAAARQVYDQMRSRTAADDITPELCLIAVLADFGQRAEIAKLVAAARKRAPDHPALARLEAWMKGEGGK